MGISVLAFGRGNRSAHSNVAIGRGLAVQENQTTGESKLQSSPDENVDSFIIEMKNGIAGCRNATRLERPLTLPRPNDHRTPIRSARASQDVSSSQNSPTGLTIDFVALSQLQNDPNRDTVIAAFQRAAAVWTARIKSPVTVSINIDYGVNSPGGNPFPSGVLGSTSSRKTQIDYPGARFNLIASSSSATESTIYNALPSSVVPTDAGNGSVVSVSRSLAFALGIPVSTLQPPNVQENIATIGFNKNVLFDFNPDDGISPNRTDFVAVATHEIGHALGFDSNAGENSPTITLWDIFRFRPGTTPDTFPTAQRIMTIGFQQVYYTSQSFTVGGAATNELGLSTGGPDGNGGDGNQSSHWKADELTGGQYIGIMDPTIARGVHEVTTENDFSTLETLGWNLVNSTPPPGPPPAPPPPANDNFSSAQVLSGCSGSVNGINVGATSETGEPNHSPDNGGGHRSVWYQWQAPSSGMITITTAGSRFDTVLGVYTGSAVNSLTTIAKDDDGGGSDHTSRVSFTANGGTVYRIAVDGYDNDNSGGDMGSLAVNWQAPSCVPLSYSVSGRITDTGNNPVSGVSVLFELTLQGTRVTRNTLTDTNGNYTSGDVGCQNNVVVTPSKPGYTFSPLSMSFVSTGCLSGSDTANFSATPPPPNNSQLSQSSYSVGEGAGSITITVTRSGNTSADATVDYATSDISGLTACTVIGSQASERCDYETTVGTLRFAAGETSKSFIIPIVDDVLVENLETFTVTLRSPAGTTLGSPPTASVTITENDTVPATQNPIDGVQFFVTLQYLDFLGRLPDPTGLANWMATLNGCPNGGFGENDHPECDRVHVSAGFFLSPEFQGRGYWAYKFYEVGFDRRPTYAEFVPDMAKVGGPQSPESEVLSKAAYTVAFEQRPEFRNRYDSLSNTNYVNALEQNSEVTISNKTALIADLEGHRKSRGEVLREIVESQPVDSRFFIRAFVSMQYFGYLRRDPDTNGFNNWVNTLNADPSNYRHMIFGFLFSNEYRTRFGP